jgi:hypothetical protein
MYYKACDIHAIDLKPLSPALVVDDIGSKAVSMNEYQSLVIRGSYLFLASLCSLVI